MKYHVKVSVHPIGMDENEEEYIDDSTTMMSSMSQGDGLKKREAINLIEYLNDNMEDGYDLDTVSSLWIEDGIKKSNNIIS